MALVGMCNYGPTGGGANPTRTTTENGIFHMTHYIWGSSNVEWPWHGSQK